MFEGELSPFRIRSAALGQTGGLEKMSVLEMICGVVICLVSVLIVAAILMQEHKANMGALSGAASDDSFGRNMGKTTDAMLGRATKILTIVLFVFVVLVGVLEKFSA